MRPEPFDGPAATALISELQAEYVVRYGGPDETPVEPDQFAPPKGFFLVAYLDEAPVGCGGWRLYGEDAELKRMFIVSAARGRGLARAVLAQLEAAAAAAGATRMILETGTKQPEAIALYESSGYEPVTPFGHYRDSPNCRCYAKPLSGNAQLAS